MIFKEYLLKSFNFEGCLVFEHFFELFILDFPVAWVIDGADQLLNIDGEFEFLLDDLDQNFSVDMAWLVSWSSDGSIGIESDFVIVAVEFCFSFFLIDFEDLLEIDDAGVIGV